MNQTSFNKLISDATRYLYQTEGLQPTTVDYVLRAWGRLRDYIHENRIKFFNHSVCEAFLNCQFKGKETQNLISTQKRFCTSITRLWEFYQTGKMVNVKNRKKDEIFQLLASIDRYSGYRKPVWQILLRLSIAR